MLAFYPRCCPTGSERIRVTFSGSKSMNMKYWFSIQCSVNANQTLPNRYLGWIDSRYVVPGTFQPSTEQGRTQCANVYMTLF